MQTVDPKADLSEAVSVINELLLAHSKEGGEVDRRLSRIDAQRFVDRITKLYVQRL